MVKRDQRECWKSLKYRKEEEGFDYCFEGYSDWEEIEDLHFHELRQTFLNARKNLDTYINEKVND